MLMSGHRTMHVRGRERPVQIRVGDAGPIQLVVSGRIYASYETPTLAALTSSGHLAPVFEGRAFRPLDIHYPAPLGRCTLAPDGGLYVTGFDSGDLTVRHWWPDGTIDSGFGVDGVAKIPMDGHGPHGGAQAIARPNGSIAVAGIYRDGSTSERRLSFAALDDDGNTLIPFTLGPVVGGGATGLETHSTLWDLVYQPTTGGLVIWWDSYDKTFNHRLTIRRWTHAGVPDGAFGTGDGSFVRAPFIPSCVTATADGGLVAVGRGGRPSVGRLLPSGVPDVGFGDHGWVEGPDASEGWHSALVLADGSVIVAGEHVPDIASQSELILRKVTPQGDIDGAFGTDGLVSHDLPGWESDPVLRADSTGRIIVAVAASDRLVHGSDWDWAPWVAVRRFSPEGLLDAGFGSGGHTTFDSRHASDDTPRFLHLIDETAAVTADAGDPHATSGLIVCDDQEATLRHWFATRD